ncbi:hypothetical protein M2459_000673 [Parabacteroides sp. PF5-5]|uniref:DUF6029 family protein n=1 Tax=unclassified Parabacteroides TaxID=2649774 RepID=UPI0024750A64|nr:MULTISPECIES: DUF6029 family protein [unclassified Parabacteroides]MDH6303393.1 hypothetical protein [Parabacteroides sp. PH5-39]MDH6314716.1 hypothetical protein [Parabacteroides sp. PF5-13]MDH6318053.1 hypothetical protein [Parabacteroides sp. PH5-13]MDH6322016.1 hypothetical protein [Parabacteroides sp. PH5-8]MDH6326139.1 hypothetical protein [Parabacteroides sp. PH5-41]
MKKTYLIGVLMFILLELSAQKDVTVSGSLQSDILFPESDQSIGTESYKEKVLTNTYLDLSASYLNYLTVGARLEYLEHPLPGFEKDFAGWGVPYFYATGRYRWAELTVGDFYDQFGNGLIFRTYEERSLGIDNSIRGGRLLLRPLNGLRLKALGGKQRRYWKHNDSYVWGTDAEINIDEWLRVLSDHEAYWLLGGSYVGKHEKDEAIYIAPDKRLNLPLNVAAFDARMQFQKGGLNLIADYAWKINDPSYDNGYSYDNGNALLLSASYSKKGMSVLLQAKRSENMSYRSDRSMSGSSSFINHLPAFTQQQTYTLPALYPYATQPLGEWAFQGETAYNFERNTVLGGKYGTLLKLHASHIRSLKDEGNGETYYQDVNVSVEKRLTEDFKLNLMYMNQRYNQRIVEGHAENGDIIHSNIYVAEGTWQMNDKVALRSELQYLNTKQGEGDWMFALVEVSWPPYLMFSVSDLYNSGVTDLHYYMGTVTFTHKAHRLQAAYGRTRAGYNCAGGVCRYVPASKGFQLSYNFNF